MPEEIITKIRDLMEKFMEVLSSLFNKSEDSPPQLAGPGPLEQQRDIEEKLHNYFQRYVEDRANYELHIYYSRQFNLKEFRQDYQCRVDRIGTVFDLGLPVKAAADAEKVLQKMVGRILSLPSCTLNAGKCLIFLHEYYDYKSRLEALKKIEDLVEDKDKLDQFVRETRGKINQLFEEYT